MSLNLFRGTQIAIHSSKCGSKNAMPLCLCVFIILYRFYNTVPHTVSQRKDAKYHVEGRLMFSPLLSTVIEGQTLGLNDMRPVYLFILNL
jgi:hypothetical protein